MQSKHNINDEEYINKINIIQNYIEKGWESFVLCEFGSGMKCFEKIMIGLDEIITCMENVKSQSKLNIDFNNILSILQNLEKSINIKDYVYSADLLKYEISPILDTWKNKLEIKFNN